MLINLRASNNSERDLGIVTATLVQRTTYLFQCGSRQSDVIIRQAESGKVKAGECVVWENFLFHVDAAPPSAGEDVAEENPVRVGYFMNFSLRPDDQRNVPALTVTLPVVIATLPFQAQRGMLGRER